MEKIELPRKAVYRLSVYQRCLQRLRENDVETVSSEALAKAAGVKSTQLRKDLGYVGQFGTRGLGSNVSTLADAITAALGSTRLQPVILVGVGNLGAALLRYSGFRKEGFEVIASFDRFPVKDRVIGTGVPLLDASEMEDYIASHSVKMAILAVPATDAQTVANQLVRAGVQAILNFSPIVLEVPENVYVNNVDLAIELESLSYFIR